MKYRAWFALAICTGLSLSAHAAGDARVGEKKFYTCLGCHGIANYKNAYPDYSVPKLHGQNAEYIVAALQEYKSGERPHATMHAQAASLSDQDMLDIAAYLQGPDAVRPTQTVVGTKPKPLATCAACHGENGRGVDAPMTPKPPVLAGQHGDYLEQALIAYRNGRRKNAIMAGMAQSLANEDEVRIMAAYFASQASPLHTVPGVTP
jgi:cytochrome c553